MAQPTPTNPPPAVTLELSRAAVDFGDIGIGDNGLKNILVKPSGGSGFLDAVTITGDSAIQLLSPSQTTELGGVPCVNELSNICVIYLNLDTVELR